ncbi:MAG TPA: hypothetical protein VLA83_02195, partial [Candidatus Binatia bacterium]|nr:hypothetical protein [Candidatus Binatia bacterium]
MKKPAIPGAFALLAGLLSLCSSAMAANGSHAPIRITKDSDFQACNCVASGSGSTTDPFIIGPLTINSLGAGKAAVFIDGTSLTKSF